MRVHVTVAEWNVFARREKKSRVLGAPKGSKSSPKRTVEDWILILNQ
jgi:hypothetical protein